MKPFEVIKISSPKKAAFDLSEERKTTFNMGELIPVMCKEVLPGDTFKIDFEAFLRTQPLISPVMHRVNLYAHTFFVPMRLLLNPGVWEKFITQQTGAVAKLPRIEQDGFKTAGYTPVKGDLFDHLDYGLALGVRKSSGEVSQLPIRAYHLIWNEYYRDQNFQTAYDILGLPDSMNNDVPLAFAQVRKRAWEKDYFTSCLPTPQRGSEIIAGLTGYADTVGKHVRTPNSTLVWSKASDNSQPAITSPTLYYGQQRDSLGNDINIKSGLETNLATSGAGAAVSSIRRAFALQRWYEASMRFGQRYVEQLLGLFGVVSKDARLQRPEYLTGGKIPVQIGDVVQTSATAATVQGNMAGKGLSVGQISSMDRTFDEHGFIMTIVSCMPRTSYMNPCARQNLKTTVFDFAFPQLANLTEQPVYRAEVDNGDVHAKDKNVFGYQPIYEEYRYGLDTVHGDFRDTLKFWGITREVTIPPTLGPSFVECNPRTDIFPVAFAANQLILQTFSKITAIRPLPKFGNPI